MSGTRRPDTQPPKVALPPPPPKATTSIGEVWVLSYLNPSDEHDNGVLGVYTTEQLARDSAVAKAVEGDLNLLGKRVFWQGDTLMYGDRGQSYPVRLCWSVDRWEVLGS